MITITSAQLKAIMPAARNVDVYLGPLNLAMSEFGIAADPLDAAAFLANVGHETGQLAHVEEGLNYSAERLVTVWPRRFPNIGAAVPYARNPQALANHVYANRGGNGDAASGDGWRHRGAGGIQITFKNSQMACAAHFGLDADTIGDWLRTPEGAMRSAAWFWESHGVSALARAGEFDNACDLVNLGHATDKVGDSIGYADRLAIYNRARQVLSC